mgnify:CR=1 FL=1
MRRVIGVAGTAKNTGKTTTLQAVAAYLRSLGKPILLTSIGYDGEDLDTVTGLPKPKIPVAEGDFVATALPLMEASSVRFRWAEYAGVDCALGPVYFGMAGGQGIVVLAGPARADDLEKLIGAVPSALTVLLDGAFSRLAPMSVASHMVLATGAARHREPSLLAAEIEAVATVMAVKAADAEPQERAGLSFSEGLYVEGADVRLFEAVRSAGQRTVYVEGPVNPHLVRSVLRMLARSGRRIDLIFRHPVDMLLSGDFLEWPEVLREAEASGHRVLSARSSRLLGFTLNPYLPELDAGTGRYTPSILPARWFLDSVRSVARTPCTDIVLEGPGTLEEWLRQVVCCNH